MFSTIRSDPSLDADHRPLPIAHTTHPRGPINIEAGFGAWPLGLALVGIALTAGNLVAAQTTLLNASYDVAREFYKDYSIAFVAHYKKTTCKDVKIDQARAVNDGLDADVVTVNTTTDIELLARGGRDARHAYLSRNRQRRQAASHADRRRISW